MGLRLLGRFGDMAGHADDGIKDRSLENTEGDKAQGFLRNFIDDKLPSLITNLAIRVVDDGSGSVAKGMLDAGTDKNFMGGIFR